jgi:hypothetical protein
LAREIPYLELDERAVGNVCRAGARRLFMHCKVPPLLPWRHIADRATSFCKVHFAAENKFSKPYS